MSSMKSLAHICFDKTKLWRLKRKKKKNWIKTKQHWWVRWQVWSAGAGQVQVLTQPTKQLNAKSCEDEEEQEEEQAEVSDLRESLHDRIKQGSYALGHLEKLKHCR